MSVQAARAREAAASDPGTFGLSGGAQSTANDDTAEDDAENTEEKRRAAAEEHADASSKRFPHGRL